MRAAEQLAYSTTSAEAGRILECGPMVLAYLVQRGLLRVKLRGYPYPTWDSVAFETSAVRALLAAPGELARARERATRFRMREVERASAVGAVITALGQ